MGVNISTLNSLSIQDIELGPGNEADFSGTGTFQYINSCHILICNIFF